MTLKPYLDLARISNSPTVVSNVLVGLALAGYAVFDAHAALVAGAMVCFYTAGMVLNDLLDVEIDRRERPSRPLPSGQVPISAAWGITVALFLIGSVMLALTSWAAFVAGLALIAMIVLYDAWHKTNPLSPLVMALTRAMVYVTAFASLTTNWTLNLGLAALMMLSYIVGLTFIAKQEGTPGVLARWPLLLLMLPAVVYAFRVPLGWTAVLPVLLFGWVMLCYGWLRRGRVGLAIGRLIAGVSLLDALLLASFGWQAGVLVALGLFMFTLVLQRWVRGT
ncbi:MAG: UbiA family prenyltransferase [Rhodothermales bacterium]